METREREIKKTNAKKNSNRIYIYNIEQNKGNKIKN